MLADKEFLESMLDFMGKRLKHEVEGLLIGGNAMIYYGLKGQTKDLDLVFFARKDIAGVARIILSHPLYKKSKVLTKIPYKIKPELLKIGKPTIIGNKDLPRFDLFYKYVFSIDVEAMFKEANKSIRFDLLKLKLVNAEHIIFLKAVSARPVDLDDIIRIVTNLEINWNELAEFIKKYFKKDRKPVWFALGSFYDINKERRVIPDFVIKKIEALFS